MAVAIHELRQCHCVSVRSKIARYEICELLRPISNIHGLAEQKIVRFGRGVRLAAPYCLELYGVLSATGTEQDFVPASQQNGMSCVRALVTVRGFVGVTVLLGCGDEIFQQWWWQCRSS